LRGKVEKIKRREAKDGSPYLSLRINGESFTLWDEKLFDQIEENSLVEYRWKPSGKYKRIVEIRKIETTEHQDEPNEEIQMIRMSALRSACMLYAHDDLPPAIKRTNALLTAITFELYLSGDKSLDSYRAFVQDAVEEDIEALKKLHRSISAPSVPKSKENGPERDTKDMELLRALLKEMGLLE